MILKRKLRSLNKIEVVGKRVEKNFHSFERKGVEVWPVVKANAYGHGIEVITGVLKRLRVKRIVADSYYEALRVWKIWPEAHILVIGTIHPLDFGKLKWKNLVISIQDGESLKELGELNKKVKIHLKFNTGMNRQGFDEEDIDGLAKLIKGYKKVEVEGIFSHLADADGETDEYTKKQVNKFLEIKKKLAGLGITPEYCHLAATYGSGKVRNKEFNAIRLGIGLYLSSLRLVSTITKVRKVGQGEKVSYNCTYETKKGGCLGVIPVGYYEALDRRLSNRGVIKYKNKFYPIAGRVCMNLTVIDFGKTRPKEFEEVEVIGLKGKNSIEEMAKMIGTIPYEVMVKLSESIRREIIES